MSPLEAALSAHWAMLPESVEKLVAIADRDNITSPEALQAYRAAYHDRGERMKVRDGVAILDVSGPLFKKANLFVQISGATSYEILRRDLQTALDDPAVNAIMLTIDSPGGEANGCDELAAAIFDARAKKPVHAFVSGMACSGGYWLASAAEKIVVSDLAVLGSIGVVLSVTDRKKADERNGVSRTEFVSSMSPGKRPDHGTDEGKARIQKMVDDLGAVFVTAVAKHRGVKVDTVVEKFGAGGVEIGANAVAAGMADTVGQFETAFAALKTRGSNRRFEQRSSGGFSMSNEIDVTKVAADAAEKARTDERKRISDINAAAGSATKLAAALVDAGTETAAAVALLKAAGADIEAAKATVKPPVVEQTPEEKTAAFEKKQAEAGALGFAAPDARGGNEQEKIQSGWKAAADRANVRFGDAGVK